MVLYIFFDNVLLYFFLILIWYCFIIFNLRFIYIFLLFSENLVFIYFYKIVVYNNEINRKKL